ncbi:MAG: NAD(P)-binding protein, partial [Rickettsiales bacterium]|nr:NAD(P)-binding protein [Rickettsiales bacterium]
MKIAVIGAGISGLVTANKLAKDFAVTVFEKARGVGGRMSTRSAVDLQFDHGAQHFVAKSAVFQNFLQDLESKKIVARFDADFCEINNYKITHRIKWSKDYPHYVATPKMNSLCKYLAQNLTVKTQTPVKNIFAKNNQWQLFDEENNDLGIFDWVICSAPAKQTIDLMPENFVHLSRVKKTKMLGCFALMLAFDRSLPIDWQMALVKNSKISWISLDSAKPQRSQS